MDQKKLEEELLAAASRERQHKEVDDMKKRAITSAQSYEEFKNLVACAGMKPLHREDFAKKAVTTANRAVKSSDSVGFGYLTVPRTDKVSEAVEAMSAKLSLKDKAVIASSGDFDRQWRRLTTDADKVALLVSIAAEKYKRIFAVEIDSMLLGQIIAVMDRMLHTKALSPAEILQLVQILEALTGAGMFSMATMLLSASEKDAVSRIADAVNETNADLSSAVKKAYGI